LLESITVHPLASLATSLLEARGSEESGIGLWIFLAVIAVGVAVAVRTISRANMRRLQRGSGPETVQDIKSKREDRKARKEAEAERAEEARERAAAKKAATGNKKGNKKKDNQPGKTEQAKPDLLLPPGKDLGEGLKRTRSEGFIGRLGKVFKGKQIDESLLGDIEEVLYTADIGVRTSDKLIAGLRTGLQSKELNDEKKVWAHLRNAAETILRDAGSAESLKRPHTAGHPYVLLIIGVNGAGKTTSIGKLSHRLVLEDKKVLVGAGDTYRAGAVDQLAVWAKRVGAELIEGKEGADPASVLFDAVKAANAAKSDVVLLDTAGRLHTNANLVAELKKVSRTVSKAQDGAPHEVLLVLDATNGQNAIAQAHTFTEALGVTGIVLTKLDGTAKGGVILGIADELKIPIAWVGVGERTEDLRPFDPKEFVDALFPGDE
jgi:fused signal recognition particle receptor